MKNEVTLYIVDDEPMAVNYFKSVVQEASPEYRMVGESYGGVRLPEDIVKVKPDILFLDISMPVMSGLKLAEKILSQNPSQKIVLLTSYRDFDYVKKGMELGVCAYLLKNELSPESLSEVVEKIRAELSLERKKLHSYTEENVRRFLYSNAEDMHDDLVYKNHSMQRFALLYILEDVPLGIMEEGEQYHSFDVCKVEDMKYPPGLICRNAITVADGRWCGIYFLEQNVADSREVLKQAADLVIKTFAGQGISVSCIFSDTVKKFLELPGMYQELNDLRKYCFSYGKGQILTRAQLLKRREKEREYQKNSLSLLYTLEEEDINAATFIVETTLAEAAEKAGRAEYLRVLRNMDEVLKQYANKKNLDISFLSLKTNFDSVEEARDFFLDVVRHLFEQMEQQREGQYSYPVLASIAFIRDNYQRDISIQDIANAAGISEGHLRKCFRQELAVSVVEYLTGYRIDKAKKLIESREYKVSEIYRHVGFTSSQYFSYVFKKLEGITPGEYLRRV